MSAFEIPEVEHLGGVPSGAAPVGSGAAGSGPPDPLGGGPEPKTLEGFAGPGGFSEALRMLGITDTLGIEVNADAIATAETAGHRRLRADIRDLEPDDFPDVTMWVSGPPCPTYSDSGHRSGITDYAVAVEGVRLLGDGHSGLRSDDAYADTYRLVSDERTGLVVETLRWALRLPNVELVIAEQVPAVHQIWEEICSELACVHDFESCSVITVRADDFGAATRRERTLIVAARDHTPDLGRLPLRRWWSCGRFSSPRWREPTRTTPFPRVSMASALGWPSGVRINTRGASTAGGNEFSADQPSNSLTTAARTWRFVDRPGNCLTPSQAGMLQTFPADYPWRGSRTSRFGRIADAVPPVMAVAVIGAALGLEWEDAVWLRLGEVYGVGRDAERSGQLDLFGEMVA